jgi:hypothetical protein
MVYASQPSVDSLITIDSALFLVWYVRSKVNVIVEVLLFPGIVTVDRLLNMALPVISVPAQNVPPRLALFNDKVLFPAPPLTAFQTTWTSETVTVSCGFVIDKLIVLLTIMRLPVVIPSQPGFAVGVVVGVNVTVGV